jgi:hypothetical protein
MSHGITSGDYNPVGDALVSPKGSEAAIYRGDTGPPQGPVTNPEEIKKNRNLWQKFNDKVKADPNFRQAVLQTGLGMMKTARYGEGSFDVVSNALSTGVTTLDMLRRRDMADKLQKEEESRKYALDTGQLTVQQTNAAANTSSAASQAANAAENAAAGKAARDQAPEELKLKQGALEADMIRANADKTRASIYAGGGFGGHQTAARVQVIHMLAAPAIAAGTPEDVALRDASIQEATLSRMDPAIAIMKMLNDWKINYEYTAEGATPMTPEKSAAKLLELKAWWKETHPAATPAATPIAAPAITRERGRGSGSATLEESTVNPAIDPGTMTWIRRQVELGVTPQKIREGLVAGGIDPTPYGYGTPQPLGPK